MRIEIRWLLACLVIVSLGVAPNVAFGQEEQPGQPQQEEQPGQPQQESARVITGLELEGELKGVDPEQRIILLVGEEGNEMLFYYDDATEVTGQTQDVQGLTGQAGTWLRIQYRAEGTTAFAERIESVDRGQEGAAETPGQPGAEPDR